MSKVYLGLLAAVAAAVCLCILGISRRVSNESEVLFDEANSERKIRNRVHGSEFNHDPRSHYTVWHRGPTSSCSLLQRYARRAAKEGGGRWKGMRHDAVPMASELVTTVGRNGLIDAACGEHAAEG
eukprot:762958-Hanusia_phi.AAC.5